MGVIVTRCGKSVAGSFSVQFCKAFLSEELAGRKVWWTGDRQPSWEQIRAFCEKGEEVLTVLGEDVMISGSSLDALEAAVESQGVDIAGPLLGGNGPEQSPTLPFSYHDVSTFREVSRWIEKERKNRVRRVESLSPRVFSCRTGLLGRMGKNLSFRELPEHPGLSDVQKGIVEGSLAHCFAGYYAHPRADLAGLVSEGARTVLDVGCGEGGLGVILRNRLPGMKIAGVEPDPAAAEVARRVYDEVYSGPIESFDPRQVFDCIICGDVLEHLKDPWQVLSSLGRILAEGGWLIGSCPNAGHWSVVRSLLEGRFPYVPAGILCWDHIRFFTEESLREMLTMSGFQVGEFRTDMPAPTPEGKRFMDMLEKSNLGDRSKLMAAAFTFKARKK